MTSEKVHGPPGGGNSPAPATTSGSRSEHSSTASMTMEKKASSARRATKARAPDASDSLRVSKVSLFATVVFLFVTFLIVGVLLVRPHSQEGPMIELLREVKGAFDLRFPEFESNQLLREVETAMRGRALRLEKEKKSMSRPGVKLAQHRVANNPVVIVPGITSVALELWKGKTCASTFRERWWGSAHMAVNAMRNQQCWLEHLVMNYSTWGDPDGIKVRPVTGMAATEYLFPGFFVWAKVIENLADVGYEPNNMHVATFDWRLTPQLCETRDMYFTSLASQIELLRKFHKQKVALVCHSMGCLWVFYFLNFASRGMGAAWLEENMDTVINIAPSMLGVPKALGAILSGDMKDSAEFGQIGKELMNRMFGSRKIPRMMRSVGSIASMLPMGSDKLWDFATRGKRKMVTFSRLATDCISPTCSSEKPGDTVDEVLLEPIHDHHTWAEIVRQNLSKSEALEVLGRVAPRYQKLLDQHFEVNSRAKPNPADSRQWSNPWLLPLPGGTGHMRIYCIYGLFEEATTETGYTYGLDKDLLHSAMPLVLDTSVTDGETVSGVHMGPGDGSVPLISLGHVCAMWQRGRNNPEGAQVVIREHRERKPVRAMEKLLNVGDSANHVEILGHSGVLADLLTVVTRAEDDKKAHPALTDKIFSDIQDITDSVLKED